MSYVTQLIQEKFPGRAIVRPVEAGRVLGWAPQTVRNRLAAGRFPVPLVQLGNKLGVRVVDLIQFLDSPPPSAVPVLQVPVEPTQAPRRPGRPRKAAQAGEGAQ